jgi:hypothetical protein
MPEQDNLNAITRQEHDTVYHTKKVSSFLDNGDGTLVRQFVEGLAIPKYDYVSVAYPDATTETYTFKTGGAGGTTVATVSVVYTDSTKESLSTVTKT